MINNEISNKQNHLKKINNYLMTEYVLSKGETAYSPTTVILSISILLLLTHDSLIL